MKTADFDYNLSKDLIAQKPMRPRDHSRLLIFDRKNSKVDHQHFYDIEKYLRAGDILVLNDTKVFKARLLVEMAGKPTELFFLRPVGNGEWEILARPGKRLKVGVSHPLAPSGHPLRHWRTRGRQKPPRPFGPSLLRKEGINFCVMEKHEDGVIRIKFNVSGKKIFEVLEKYGHVPVPPYVGKEPKKEEDYQTVYADKTGSVAAPTAGFHFTPALIKRLKNKGVIFKTITLHVGIGTFQPVKVEKIEKHQMHAEFVIIDKSTADFLNRARLRRPSWRSDYGGRSRIIAVGTTTARALEASADKKGRIKPQNNFVNIFIYPGYKFRVIDGLVTNFHLPKSTLIMLVSAFIGSRRKTLKIYGDAIKKKYRFYSFGDAMMIK